MIKHVFFAATSVLALVSGVAMAGRSPALAVQTTGAVPVQPKSTTLYSQISDPKGPVVSDNYTSGFFATNYDNAGADDFVVPQGKTWKFTDVDVTGQYGPCALAVNCGPATSEVITFYADANGLPGKMVGKAQTLHCNDHFGSFACAIKTVSLKGGTTGNGTAYWVSVVANMDATKASGWNWRQTSVHGNPAVWENPGAGLDGGLCNTWEPIGTCFQLHGAPGDLAFDLKGRSK